jgi:hypothetical protein
MRSQVITVVAGVLGALGGGWLVGVWCFGVVLIVLSAGAIAWGLFHDDGKPAAAAEWQPQVFAFGTPDPEAREFIGRVRGAG